eukprot:11193472-Lingulodinium_polyedra.AAC.1
MLFSAGAEFLDRPQAGPVGAVLLRGSVFACDQARQARRGQSPSVVSRNASAAAREFFATAPVRLPNLTDRA